MQSIRKVTYRPRTKGETLSETTKSYLVEVYVNEMFGRQKNIESKYLNKGLQVEEQAIELYSQYKLGEYFGKNEKHFKNDFIKGTPDIITNEKVLDCKAPYDIFTFFQAMTKPLDKDYEAQLNGYMWLTGKKQATLFYALIDTPKPLIFDEQRRLQWKMAVDDSNPEFIEATNVIENNLTYTDLPLERKIHEIDFEYNQELIDKLQERIILSRIWLAEFHLKQISKTK